MVVKRMSLDGDRAPHRDSTQYYIRNKDEVLGSFRWIGNAVELVEDKALPEFISTRLASWVGSRTPPKHREYMYKLLELLQLHGARAIIDYSKGLSLIDTLWITPDLSLSWGEVNLFDNEFDEVIARTAFDGGMHGAVMSTTSPEFGTDGMLPKCWVREPTGQIQLYKGGTGIAYNAGREPYCEVMASQVLSRLGYSHVSYTLGQFHGRLVSKCPLLTSQKTMMLASHRYYNFNDFGLFMRKVIADGFGTQLAEYLVFDYLTANTDRHAGNIAVLLDADSFEVQGLAPIYDNGMSLLCYIPRDMTAEEYAAGLTPAMYQEFDQGVLWAKQLVGSKHNVERLIDFKFDRSKLGDFPEDAICLREEWLQTRVSDFLAL